jgi:hypothetical protein
MLCSTCGVVPHRRQRPNCDLGWFESDTVVVCDCETCCECGQASSILVFPWEALPQFDGYRWPDHEEEWTTGPLPYGDEDVSHCRGEHNQRYCRECYRNYHKNNPVFIHPSDIKFCKMCQRDHPLYYFRNYENNQESYKTEVCYSCIHQSILKGQCHTCNRKYEVAPAKKQLDNAKTCEEFKQLVSQLVLGPCPYCEHTKEVKYYLGLIGITKEVLKTYNTRQLSDLCYRTQIYVDWRHNYKEGLIKKLARYL